MATTLDVVNQCLAIMGEVPLNSITEEHGFKTAAINILTRNNSVEQARGWWFNQEYLTLTVNPTDNRIYLPNDTGSIQPVKDRPDIVQRGRVLYDLRKGTDMFAAGTTVDVILVRKLAFELTPDSFNAYVARKTVLDFQQEYDGDQTKTRNLMAEVYGNPPSTAANMTLGLKGALEAEHIRYKKVNFIQQSTRLRRITNRVNYSRRPY